jgi:hypothetical protein
MAGGRVLVCSNHDHGATHMSLPHLTTMYYDGTMLTGPARPRSNGDQAALRATVRTRRLARVRGT